MTVYFERLSISTQTLTYYSIRFHNERITEYEKFMNKSFPNHILELNILRKVLTAMGVRGAKPHYFKPEHGAFALPFTNPEIRKKNKKDFGIRLYCLLLTPRIVVLLNGDIKTVKGSAQNCPNVSKFFTHAVRLANKFQKAYDDEYVSYEGNLFLKFDEDYYLDI